MEGEGKGSVGGFRGYAEKAPLPRGIGTARGSGGAAWRAGAAACRQAAGAAMRAGKQRARRRFS